MAGEKRFDTSMFGFNKSDVNFYIEKMLKEFDDKLKEKDAELEVLKNQNKDLKVKFDELSRKSEHMEEVRTKIADVLINAQEKAETIVQDAKTKAMEEKKSLEQIIEQEKEKIVDIKHDLKTLKAETVDMLRKYEAQLSSMIGE